MAKGTYIEHTFELQHWAHSYAPAKMPARTRDGVAIGHGDGRDVRSTLLCHLSTHMAVLVRRAHATVRFVHH
eukprot:6193277-Pleurochrysis_carterae.AAC.1